MALFHVDFMLGVGLFDEPPPLEGQFDNPYPAVLRMIVAGD
jgi:hypothetical protein